MTSKIVLVSSSTGERGNDGKKKIYEIVVIDNKVVLRWGKAEEETRQTQTKWFGYSAAAKNFAMEKMIAKLDKGYEVAFQA
jgi:predicted DNA-binding WGR domain protein